MPGIVIQIQGDGTGAAEALQLIENKMRETAAAARETSDAMEVLDERILKGAEYFGIYASIEEVVDGMKELIGGSIELGEELGHLSRQTGISVQNLSLLKVASEESGVSFESLTKGFKKLGTSLLEYQENSRTTIDAFKLLNISQADLAKTGGDVFKVMELVADRMQSMPDGWKKSAAAVQLFGRAGQELIPVLDQGAAGISKFSEDAQRFGLTLDNEGTEKMEAFYESSQRLKLAIQGLGIALTETIEPAVTAVSGELTDATSKSAQWEKGIASGAKVAIQAAEGINWLAQNMRQLGDEIQEVADVAFLPADEFAERFGVTEARRKQAKINHDADLAELKQAKDDHQSSLDEEKHFQDAMAKLYEQLDHPEGAHAASAPSRAGDNSIAPPSSGRKRHGKDEDEITARSGNLIDREAKEEERQMQEVADAKLRLTEAMDRSELQKATSHSQSLLAILAAHHAAGLETDAEFYDAKLKLEEQMFDAEKSALEKEQQDLQSAIDAQPAGSPKSFELRAQLVGIETHLAELTERRKVAEAEITAELERQQKVQKDQMDPGVSALLKEHQRQQAEMARESAGTISRMLSSLTDIRGKDPLREITTSMIGDMERLALKMMEERWIIPMMQSMFGIGGGAMSPLQTTSPTLTTMIPSIPGFASGGDPTGLSIVGEKGPELFVPKGPGTILPNDVLDKVSSASEGGHGPNVTVNVSNQSSQPVTMRQTGMSYDAQAKHFVLHTVLEDLSSGGPMSQAMKGFGGG